jgi:hypothetical protein
MKKIKIKILKEHNPAGRRIKLDAKYNDLVNANIKTVLLSARYKSSKAINKFYVEDIKYLENLLKSNIYKMAARVKLTLDAGIVNQAVEYAVKDAVSGKYDNLKESDSLENSLNSKKDNLKKDLAKINKDKAELKARKAREKLDLLSK